VRLRLGVTDAPPGVAAWRVRGLAAGTLDGLRTEASSSPPREPVPPSAHVNGALALDHVVVATPNLDRTLGALAGAGLELRRIREAGSARQAFYRVGEALLEVVGPVTPDGDGPAAFWGLTVTVADLDAAAARLGPLVGAARDAVQPGRRIATVRRAAGLGTAVALMTPAQPR
jgi:hypothetical protein